MRIHHETQRSVEGMDFTIEQLAAHRAKRIWEFVLDVVFNQVDRQTYHQDIEPIEPMGLWNGELFLGVPTVHLNGESETYQPLVWKVAVSNPDVKKIKWIESHEKFHLDMSSQLNWISNEKWIRNFWEQVLDQFPERSNRETYQLVKRWFKPLAKLDQLFVLETEFHLSTYTEEVILDCLCRVDPTVSKLEIVQLDRFEQLKEKRAERREKRKLAQSLEVATLAPAEDDTVKKEIELWESVLTKLSDQIAPPSFQTWVQPIEFDSCENGVMTITTPNNFSRDWLQSRYQQLIQEVVNQVDPSITTLRIICKEDLG
jgi:hypothetical protein